MQSGNLLKSCLLLATLFLFGEAAHAQTDQATPKKKKPHSIYGSWGYNEEWYTNSTVHVRQNGEGNDYQLVHVQAHDHKGWDEGIFNKALTIPQYNYRLGYYFNDKQDLAIELNFDHTKYIIQDGQRVTLKGKLQGDNVSEPLVYSAANGFHYYLNNGANFFLINIVKRLSLYHTQNNYFHIDLLGKAGIGPVIPHVDNSFFGEQNNPHFQFGGWNTGLETAVRFTVMKYVYFELSQKADYARYSNLKIYGGTAKQNFGTYELILSGGLTIPTTRHNPLFTSYNAAAEKK